MLPSIGIMIGAYIITRMVGVLSVGGERFQGTATKVFAVITIIVALIVMFDLFLAGTRDFDLNLPSQLPRR